MVSFAPFRRLIMLGIPFLLGLLELGHPALVPGDNIFETLSPIATWWTALHVAQVPLFALIGLAVFLLVRDLDGPAARISRMAIAIFVVVYPAFDAAVGVASGVMMRNVGSLTADQRGLVEQILQALFWGPVTGLMALVGSASWLVALVAAALAWRRAGAPALVVGLLALSGLLLGVSHIRPFGPLACLAFLIPAAWIEFAWVRPGST
jgi:hypothetical protein